MFAVVLLAGIRWLVEFNFYSLFSCTCTQRSHQRKDQENNETTGAKKQWVLPVKYFSLALARSSASKYQTVIAYLQRDGEETRWATAEPLSAECRVSGWPCRESGLDLVGVSSVWPEEEQPVKFWLYISELGLSFREDSQQAAVFLTAEEHRH